MNIAALPKDVQDYISSIEENWKQRYRELEEHYKLLLIQKFCRKSEKSETEASQQLLFSEGPSTQEEAASEEQETIKTYSRKNRVESQ